ncbi:MAG: acyl carrier protein [Ruminococcus sp.]|nr:acyl carrier protein [Candidatus Copronaster equi]
METREKLLEILDEINDEIDYENETNLIDGKMLDSFSIIKLIANICGEFDIDIGPKWMKNENFNSVDAMVSMIDTIIEEE